MTSTKENNLFQWDVIGPILSFLPTTFHLYGFIKSMDIAFLNENKLSIAMKNRRWSRNRALYQTCRLNNYHVAKKSPNLNKNIYN